MKLRQNAEESSYNVKILKRATIIGETTGAGAHPVSGHRVDDPNEVTNCKILKLQNCLQRSACNIPAFAAS